MARGSTTPLHDARGEVRAIRIKYDLPPDPGTGRRRQQTATVHRRFGETARQLAKRADAELAAALAASAGGDPSIDRHTTLAAYLTDRWLPHYRGTGRRIATVEAREWAVAHWIAPRLGAVKLASLKAWAIQAAYRAMQDDGLAPSSLRVVHATLRLALGQAVKWELLTRNPCAGVDLPADDPTDPPRALTPDEADALLRTARTRGDRFADLYELAILTQLRIGELLGLRWEDVDLAASVIRVEQTAGRRPGRIGPPKTKGSRRAVWLGPRARELFAAQRIEQERRRELAGDLWTERGLVFDQGLGGILSSSVVRKWLAKTAAAAGLPHVTPHDLRHTGVTWMGRARVHPFVAGDRAGHQGLGMTRHYTHMTADWQEAPALAVERVLALARLPPDEELVE